MKLEKLTEEQKAKSLEIRDFWKDYIYSCKHNVIDKKKAKEGIDFIYKLAGKKEPVIVYVESPIGCQLGVMYLKELFKQLKIKTGDSVGDSVWDSVRASVWDSVGDSVWDSVWASVGDSVGDSVRASVRDSVGDSVGASYGSIADYGWVSFYDFFTQIGVVNHEKFNQFRELMYSGVYDMIQLEGFCIVCALPSILKKNANNRLHCTTGPAIKWKDGCELYYINGRNLPAWIWEKATKNEITKEMFLKEKNQEIKAGIYEVLGQKKMLELLGAQEIDTQSIVHKNGQLETVTLLKTKERFSEISNEPFAWVKCVCPSTSTQYLLGVEPHHTNAKEAIASLSRFKAEEYSFNFRT